MHAQAHGKAHALTLAVALLLLALPALAGATTAALSGGGTAGTIALDSPAAEGSLTRDATTALAGTLSDPTAALTVNGVPVPVAPSGVFAAPLALDEGLNAFRLVALTATGGHSELLFTVTRDSTPPALSVLSPAAFAVLPDDRVTVFGTAERGATVTVDGAPAEVNPFDGTFLARDVLLAPTGTGCLQPTDIVVDAADRAGNHATAVVPVHADQCVEHPELAVPLPTLEVAAGQGAAYLDLPAYFVDDGGPEALVFSTQPVGDAVGVFSATYGTRTLTLTWSDPSFRGDALFEVVARDRTGLTSPPALLGLHVVDGPAPAAPELVAPGEAGAVPSGGSIGFTITARTAAGGPAALETLAVPRGAAATSRLAAGPEPGTYTVTLTADATLAAGTYGFVLLAHGPAGEVSSVPVRFSVYDASGDPGVAIESPSPPEVDRIVQGPGGAYGAWVEVSAARSIPHLYTEEPTSGLDAAEATALNEERTYFRFFAALPSNPGVAHVRLWVQDPGLAPVMVDLPLNVLPSYGLPQIRTLVLTASGSEATEDQPLTVEFQGFVPDPDRTTYTWRVDGAVLSHERQLVWIHPTVGVHTVTLTVESPQGSTAASISVTVRATPAPPPPEAGPLAAWPWFVLGGFAVFGVVMGGTEVGAYLLVVWLVGALIDRQSREKLLAHFVRGRIYQIIQYEPGIHLSQLQRKAGVARGVCAYHLHALEKAGLIKTSRDGMYLRFMVTKVPVDTETYALTEDERELLTVVQQTPGISERELVESLGRSAPSVSRATRKLAKSGYLEAHHAGGETIWYPRTLSGGPAPVDGGEG